MINETLVAGRRTRFKHHHAHADKIAGWAQRVRADGRIYWDPMTKCSTPQCDNLRSLNNYLKGVAAGWAGRCKKCWSADGGNKKRPYESAYNVLVAGCRKRRIRCTLSFEDYISALPDGVACHYCGQVLPRVPHSTHNTPNVAQCAWLDRRDDREGYIPSNIVPCCYACNMTKWKLLSEHEMMLVAAARCGNHQRVARILRDHGAAIQEWGTVVTLRRDITDASNPRQLADL